MSKQQEGIVTKLPKGTTHNKNTSHRIKSDGFMEKKPEATPKSCLHLTTVGLSIYSTDIKEKRATTSIRLGLNMSATLGRVDFTQDMNCFTREKIENFARLYLSKFNSVEGVVITLICHQSTPIKLFQPNFLKSLQNSIFNREITLNIPLKECFLKLTISQLITKQKKRNKHLCNWNAEFIFEKGKNKELDWESVIDSWRKYWLILKNISKVH